MEIIIAVVTLISFCIGWIFGAGTIRRELEAKHRCDLKRQLRMLTGLDSIDENEDHPRNGKTEDLYYG
jgi:hypothetical protein